MKIWTNFDNQDKNFPSFFHKLIDANTFNHYECNEWSNLLHKANAAVQKVCEFKTKKSMYLWLLLVSIQSWKFETHTCLIRVILSTICFKKSAKLFSDGWQCESTFFPLENTAYSSFFLKNYGIKSGCSSSLLAWNIWYAKIIHEYYEVT